MNGSSVRSSRNGVTEMRFSFSAARSLPGCRPSDAAASERNPVIGIAAPVMTRVDTQQLLIALALHGDRHTGDFIRRAIRKIDVHQNIAWHSGIQDAPDQVGSKFDRRVPIRMCLVVNA